MSRNRRVLLTLAFASATAGCVANHHIGDNGQPPSLTISPSGPLSLYLGQTQALTVVTSPPAQTFVWVSNSPNVVSVDETGLASALTAGSATITATLTGGAATSSVPFTAKPVGPIDPSFEAMGPCPPNAPGTGLHDVCPANWLESNCDVTGECNNSICTVHGTAFDPMSGMPTDGQLFLDCLAQGGYSEIYQDNVDFGPATTLTIDYAYEVSSNPACTFTTQPYIRFRSAGVTTDLWAPTLPCYSAQMTSGIAAATTTVPIPANLAPGRLVIGITTAPGSLIYIDNLRTQ
ncbi:MAG TPA: Ig-like domain-containing protein [Polyangia bacterium]|jgi:hypothetical protein